MNQTNQQIRNRKLATLVEQAEQNEIDIETALRVAYNFGWNEAKENTIDKFRDYIGDPDD